ncbi:MAG: glycosyl hydrolase family 28-related protein [Candidatus Bathyarchaeia archaeon]
MSQIKRFEHARSSIHFPVNDFGAVGDGVADDTKALNDAISAAENAGGGVVDFNKGNYKCLGVKPKSLVTLQGRGWGETIIKGFDKKTDQAIIDGTGYYSQTAPLTEFNIYDLEIDGTDMNRAGYHYNRKGIGNQWMKNCVFHNLFVHDTPATGIGTDYIINGYFESCLVTKCGTPGRVGNGIGSNGFGIGVSDATEVVVFSGCQAIEIANNGFTLEAQITQGVGYASITDCYTEKCGNSGYSNSGSKGVKIDGCTDNASNYGVYISSNAHQPGNQTIISSCQFLNQPSHGIYSDQAENNYLHVRGSLFESCGGCGINSVGSYCSFVDNSFKGCKNDTIFCKPASGAIGKGYLIADNIITGGDSVGIKIDPTDQPITGLLVKGNLIMDCKGPAIQAICKPDTETGNYFSALIEGNVCKGDQIPQIEVVGSSSNLIVRNNIA